MSMRIGVYYYPEQWPRAQWKRDFDNIKRMGLQIVHMAEFAWYEMEPSPGDIRLDWLEECVEMARERGLEVILCTPTAAPPIWLSVNHPETLPLGEHGVPYRFGGRRHYSPLSLPLHEATKRIVTAMAQRFGDHPSIIGWQIDNEYGYAFDQSETTHRAFQQWLQRKYGAIDKLNAAWGNQFWNTYYTSFDQILMPQGREVRYDNPHHRLDGSRFWSWAFARFNKLQADILRPRIGKRWITTNFMGFHPDCAPIDMADDLTLMSWDNYPVSGGDKDVSNQQFRMADPRGMSFNHDHMYSFNGRWAMMEVQSGHVNWSGYPVLLYPGAVRLWLWTAYAHGAELTTVYRYRQPLWGTELFHHGLVGTDGFTPSAGGREFVQVIGEMQKLREAANEPLQRSPKPVSACSTFSAKPLAIDRTVGIVWDFDNLWYYLTLPQAKRWNFPEFALAWYGGVSRAGLQAHILHPGKPWPQGLRMVVCPGLQMLDEAQVKQLDTYAANAGHLVLTCRNGLMNRNGHLWEGPWAEPILPLIGADIETYDGLPDGAFGRVELDGTQYKWGTWADYLKPREGTQVLGKYADQFYAGTPAVVQRRHGKGTVTYCGVAAENGFHEALVAKLAVQAGYHTAELPPRVQLIERDGLRIFLNFRDETIDAPAPTGSQFIVGGPKVGPAQVAIWKA